MQDDKYYIERILKGDSNAFTVLVDKHKKMLYYYAFRMVGVKEDAEEIAHDSFVKAYHSLQSFRNQSKFSTWLFRIVHNECVSWLRKKRQVFQSLHLMENEVNDLPDTVDPEKDLDEKDQRMIIHEAIGKLPEDERSIILMYYLQEFTVKEIIEITGHSESNVKVKLFRARKKLLVKLGKLTFEAYETKL